MSAQDSAGARLKCVCHLDSDAVGGAGELVLRAPSLAHHFNIRPLRLGARRGWCMARITILFRFTLLFRPRGRKNERVIRESGGRSPFSQQPCPCWKRGDIEPAAVLHAVA